MSPEASASCPKCGDVLIDGKSYCPNCGLAIAAVPDRMIIDAYVDARVNQALSAKMADQSAVVREIANRAEDEVQSRIKRKAWILAVAVPLFAIYGIRSFSDAKNAVVDEAKKRLEPEIQNTETRIENAKTQLAQSEKDLSQLKPELDGTSKLASEQNARLEKQGGEIDTKLREVEKAGAAMKSQSENYRDQVAKLEAQMENTRTRAENEARKLEATQKSIESSIQGVTARIDNANIEQAYGQLGEKLYVILQGKPFVGKPGKKAGQKWININLSPMAIGENRVTKQQLNEISQKLEREGYTPFFGTFGSGGSVVTGYDNFAGTGYSEVLYFDRNREKEASDLAVQAREILGLQEITTGFLDVEKINAVEREVILGSGLDFQIFISNAPPKMR